MVIPPTISKTPDGEFKYLSEETDAVLLSNTPPDNATKPMVAKKISTV